MLRQESRMHSYIPAQSVRAMDAANVNVNQYSAFKRIGIGIDQHMAMRMAAANSEFRQRWAMDALQPTVTQGSIGTPIQFLQNWLPGFVFVATGARNIDDFIGIATIGDWSDEMIVQGILERVGLAQPYNEYAAVPFASWNTNFVYRSVVRFEMGIMVGNLEAARAGRMNVDDSGAKREAAMWMLEIQRNSVGFNGYNSGNNGTYGFLNDPGLPNYVPVSNGIAGTPQWSTKTFLEICKDIRGALVSLRTNSQDIINPEQVPLTLAVATAAVDWLSTTSDFGISVRDWLRKAYPNVRVVSAPQLNNASSNTNVFYLYADRIVDMSTDGGAVWIQAVPAKFQVNGVQQLAKGYLEDYINATAGAFCKRPWAVVRRSGI